MPGIGLPDLPIRQQTVQIRPAPLRGRATMAGFATRRPGPGLRAPAGAATFATMVTGC